MPTLAAPSARSRTAAPSRVVHPTESAPRVAPLPVESMRPEWLATLDRIPGDGLKGPGFPRHVLGVLMRSPETFGPFLEYWVSCKERMSLPVREQEIVILRMACLYGSDYVWRHHVPVGREFGLDDATFAAIRAGDAGALESARDRALVILVDELVETRTVGRAAWDAHAAVLGDRGMVDLVALVAQYTLFALVNNAFQNAVEPTLAEIESLAPPASR
jgi:4-carboxymuconolactone decarboxylase